MAGRVILAVCVLLVAACGDSATPPTAGTGETLPGSNEDTTPPGTGGPPPTVVVPPGQEVTVRAVLDGDSLAVELDGEREEVRLLGVNAPESDECFGEDAHDLMATLVGDTVILVRDSEADRDQFGRLLRYAYSDGVFLNDVLLRRGAVLALSGDHELERQFRDSEEAAFEAGFGLWGVGVCGNQGSTEVRIIDVEYDPPGRDSENRNGEWVAIGNTGAIEIDMSGWVLRDESSRHRYRFDGYTIAPGQTIQVRVGCGDDTAEEVFWCNDDPVWSNGGDTALLLDANGNVVDRYHYAGDF